MVCHTEEAELLPPQLLPRYPVYNTILIWFLILFPVLSYFKKVYVSLSYVQILPEKKNWQAQKNIKT
jgi:hypothetical protein